MEERAGLTREFAERLEKRLDELKWLYAELYHNDENAFRYFLSMLERMYEARPEELKVLDREREHSADWYRSNEVLGMMLYTNCFAGNLRGVREKLPYLKEAGVTYIHLMPLLASPKGRSDGGYAVADFRQVEPELGTMEDFAALASDCHKSGMSVCLDFVMNHTSEDHEWARRARAGEKEFQDRYFFFDNWNIPNDFDRTVPQVFPMTAPGNFSWCNEVGKVVMTSFYPYQWDLNYANPTVFNDMTENLFFLCNQGADIIRLDAVPYIWKSLGTDCRNLPQVHTIVRIMRMAAEIVCPATQILGEVVMEPSKVVPYFGTLEKPECHILYNVTTMATTWHTVATKDVRLLKHQLGQIFALPKQYLFLNYLRCHDDIGWGLDFGFLKQFGIDEVGHKRFLNDCLRGYFYGSDARGELYNDDPRLGDARLCGTTASLCGIEAAEYEGNVWKLDRAIRLHIMLHAFLFTQSGVPVIYSGDEIGQLNDYGYHNDPYKWDDSRYLHRGNFSWDEAALRKDTESREGRIFNALRKLETMRSEHPVFLTAADTWIIETYNDHVLGIGRYYDGEKLVALFNFSPQDETAWVNEPENYTDLMTGVPRRAQAVGIPAFDFAWLLWSREEEEKREREAEAAREAAAKEAEKERKTAEKKKASGAKKTERKPEQKPVAEAEQEADKKVKAKEEAEETAAKKTVEKAEEMKKADEKASEAAAEQKAAEERKAAEEAARKTVEAVMKAEDAAKKAGKAAQLKRATSGTQGKKKGTKK